MIRHDITATTADLDKLHGRIAKLEAEVYAQKSTPTPDWNKLGPEMAAKLEEHQYARFNDIYENYVCVECGSLKEDECEPDCEVDALLSRVEGG